MASIENRAASAPPAMAKLSVSPSGSLAVTVVTAWPFSATLSAAVAPPPFEVMVGAALAGGSPPPPSISTK